MGHFARADPCVCSRSRDDLSVIGPASLACLDLVWHMICLQLCATDSCGCPGHAWLPALEVGWSDTWVDKWRDQSVTSQPMGLCKCVPMCACMCFALKHIRARTNPHHLPCNAAGSHVKRQGVDLPWLQLVWRLLSLARERPHGGIPKPA
jgi:hypothetical protein